MWVRAGAHCWLWAQRPLLHPPQRGQGAPAGSELRTACSGSNSRDLSRGCCRTPRKRSNGGCSASSACGRRSGHVRASWHASSTIARRADDACHSSVGSTRSWWHGPSRRSVHGCGMAWSRVPSACWRRTANRRCRGRRALGIGPRIWSELELYAPGVLSNFRALFTGAYHASACFQGGFRRSDIARTLAPSHQVRAGGQQQRIARRGRRQHFLLPHDLPSSLSHACLPLQPFVTDWRSRAAPSTAGASTLRLPSVAPAACSMRCRLSLTDLLTGARQRKHSVRWRPWQHQYQSQLRCSCVSNRRNLFIILVLVVVSQSQWRVWIRRARG